MRQCLPNETHQFVPFKPHRKQPFYKCILCNLAITKPELKHYARQLNCEHKEVTRYEVTDGNGMRKYGTCDSCGKVLK